jgi:hypothetical protein
MNQRSIVRFLHLKGLDATRIRYELEVALGRDALSCSTVMRTLPSAVWTQTDVETVHSEIDNAIVQALGMLPFAPVKELARRLCYAPTTISHYLTESLHCVSKCLEWAPHDLTTARKALRVEKSND